MNNYDFPCFGSYPPEQEAYMRVSINMQSLCREAEAIALKNNPEISTTIRWGYNSEEQSCKRLNLGVYSLERARELYKEVYCFLNSLPTT